ncbi:unnamed protein product [Cladocopium goreaui]|uniref:Palmitoyltransferase AKR1 n=1 Tax=Cladocopium goreaui TaxID=2562237 RepID=A0A9P1G6I3_9DINO|nr:unnamed protein product [Cladocopium goreaui]|mmetsp:Transcript_39032/g.83993  ORF Transcript_39032/g.83993 Transcript_39032/m.83993 type:complete len:213 (+) Transcript_39032:81-719(+)
MSLFFPWCCKPWSAEKAHVDQNTEYVRALPLSSSNQPHFPKAMIYSGEQDQPAEMQQASVSRTLEPVRCMVPQLSTENQEKVRLQMAVRRFVQDATEGMSVDLLDEDSGTATVARLQLDRRLQCLQLSMPDETRIYKMQDMIAIFRDKEFTSLVPGLSHLSGRCVAVDFCTERDFRLCFQFKDSEHRDNFYSCLKILRMSLDTLENPQSDED